VVATLTLRTRLRPDTTRRVRVHSVQWVKTHPVTLAGVGLVAAQLGWTAILLGHSYFRQDDFALLDGALRSGFGLSYLMSPDKGHLMPVGMAIIWVLARASLYNWLLASAVIMVLTAAASLALLRVLQTLFGARPGILVPLTLYLFAPLSVGSIAWLAAAVKILPLELALFLATDAHARYVRAPRPRHAILAALWLLIGMASADQGAVVPLLLFAITTIYLAPGVPSGWAEAAWHVLTRYQRIWVLYGTLFAGYCALFFTQLSTSGTALPGPGETTRLYRFAGTMIGTNAVPGVLGGPWRWATSGYAQAGPPAALEYLSWVIAAIVVAVCVVRGRAAWSAWAILLGWIVVADIVPVAVEGFGTLSTSTLGADTGYLADATGVLALCAGLAFLSRPLSRPARIVAIAALVVFLAGSAVSLPAFVSATPSTAVRSYIATVRVATREAPLEAVVIDSPLPAAVMSPGFFAGQARTSQLIAPLAGGGGNGGTEPRLSWATVPAGVLTSPMVFDDSGRLRPLAITGLSSVPPPGTGAAGGCLDVTGAGTSIALDGSLFRWSWIVRLSYSGPGGILVVGFGGSSSQVTVPAGRHDVYVPLVGEGSVVSARFLGSRAGTLCVTRVTVGSPHPDQAGPAIPAVPVPG